MSFRTRSGSYHRLPVIQFSPNAPGLRAGGHFSLPNPPPLTLPYKRQFQQLVGFNSYKWFVSGTVVEAGLYSETISTKVEDNMSSVKYVIMDSCVIASYYIEEAGHRYPIVTQRARTIIDHVKTNGTLDVRLVVPNICIPEIFSTFSKYRYGSWNRHVKGHEIDDLTYWRAKLECRNDLHNGKVFQQICISRYDILATDLISPPDHFHQAKQKTNPRQSDPPMGAYDHTIIGMGIQFVKNRGRDNVVILTSDSRMNDILDRVKSRTDKEAPKLGLIRVARDLGLIYSPDIYPEVINIAKCGDPVLKGVFGEWPLSSNDIAVIAKATKLTDSQKKTMAKIYDEVTEVTSEKLPYTDEFEVLCNAFVSKTGLDLSRNDIWRLLSNMRKRKELPRKGGK